MMKKLIYSFAMLTMILSCSPESTETSTYNGLSADANAKAQKENQQESLDPPVLSCGTATQTSLEIVLTAGAKGAGGGFDIHWMTEADFLANGSEWSEELLCEMGFSGNGNETYSLAANESITLNLEEMVTAAECGTVECGVTYVLRARAKNEGGQGDKGGLNKSDWTENFTCATLECAEVCTYGKGYWKNHSSENPGEQDNDWPVTELVLGIHTYTQQNLNAIMDVPNNEGNNLVIFSQHLIAAKLNVANGAGNSEIAATIEDADDLIGDFVILEDSFSEEEKKEANVLKAILEAYNESSPCDEDWDE